ncbi:hypothetical protein [uncultured Methanobrevibacter sp.]|nr:hypothetical protein [uncultured Methanobrevibacter sp.]
MLDIENLEESFNDYSKDFIKNKKYYAHVSGIISHSSKFNK